MTAEGEAGRNHATIRETYELVDETRKELNERIEQLGEKFDAVVTSNEHRLTVLETHQSAQADQLTQIHGRLDQHGKWIGDLKDQQRSDEAGTEALEKQATNRWSTHTTALTVAASLILATATILNIFHVRL